MEGSSIPLTEMDGSSSKIGNVSKHDTVLALVVATLISIILALILNVSGISKLSLSPGFKYGMVVDASSTHTSLFLYRWPANKENNTGVVSQVYSCKVEGPGISSYASDPLKSGQSLKKCLDEAMKYIPANKQHKTLAYLGATGGMRLLRLQDPAAADKVLEQVSKTMKQYPVDFRGARILTGAEEGAYIWITINYLLKSFMKPPMYIFYEKSTTDVVNGVKKYSFTGEWVRSPNTGIFGALDLSGASTQISFIPNGEMKDKRDEAKFCLYGTNYTIYTHSYPCYGWDQARKQLYLQAIAGKNVMNPVNNPCFPTGYKEIVHMGSLYDNPCTAHQTPAFYKPSDVQNVTLVGNGDVHQCHALMKKIFNFSACGNQPSCTFDGVYQPPITGKFLAFSAFYDTFSFLNLTAVKSLDTIYAKLKEFCSRDWAKLKASHPKEREDQLRDYCSSANYMVSLLLDGYKFTKDNWDSITFQKQAANTDIGWTLGYMLNQTNMIPVEAAIRVDTHNIKLWAAALFFICLALLLSLVILIIYLRF